MLPRNSIMEEVKIRMYKVKTDPEGDWERHDLLVLWQTKYKKTECRKWKHDQKTFKDKSNKDEPKKRRIGYQIVIASNDILFIGDDDHLNLACEDSSRIINSVASRHLTSYSNFFSTYASRDFGSFGWKMIVYVKSLVLVISF